MTQHERKEQDPAFKLAMLGGRRLEQEVGGLRTQRTIKQLLKGQRPAQPVEVMTRTYRRHRKADEEHIQRGDTWNQSLAAPTRPTPRTS
jgi:hypothetical protein